MGRNRAGLRFYSPKASVYMERAKICGGFDSPNRREREEGGAKPEEEERKEERSLTGGPSMSAADQRPMRDAGARAMTGRLRLGSAHAGEGGRGE
jgi:hypothetical protein